MVQPYLEEIVEQGDRRVFFLDGELLAEFVRFPKEGGFIANLAQGGSAKKVPLSDVERAVCDRLGKFLKHTGIVFAGADLIGSKVSEVNITSPTGLCSLHALEGNDYGAPILDWLEGNASSGTQ